MYRPNPNSLQEKNLILKSPAYTNIIAVYLAQDGIDYMLVSEIMIATNQGLLANIILVSLSHLYYIVEFNVFKGLFSR